MKLTELLRCPVCGADMTSDGKVLKCSNPVGRHSFDFASSGYVNLLSPGKGRNAKSGDDKTMISSRTRLLDKGYYSRISERLGSIISSFAEKDNARQILLADCACGEGYHTCNMLNTIAENGFSCGAVGLDASKYGADRCAKRFSGIASPSCCAFFAAANIFSMPLKSGRFDFATSIFAPIAAEETGRILKPGGRLIVASSGVNHLFELRRALYDEPRGASGSVKCPEGFKKESEEILCYKTDVEGNESISDLFKMTPFYYKTSPHDAKKLEKLDGLRITVEVKITVYNKE